MKAHIHITTIFTVLFIGFSTLNGQASARTGEREKQERPTVKRTEAKKVQAKQTQARQTQAKQTQARQTQAKQTQARQTQARQTQARQTQAKQTQARQTQARQTQARQTQARQTQAKHTQARQSTVKPNKGQEQRYTTRYNETAVRPVMAYNKPSKAKSNHTKPNNGSNYGRLPVKKNKYSEKHYYGGKHYHNAYPAKRVKTHYHHNTHAHHYKVLYYPAYNEIYWTRNMYRNYNKWYPNYRWRYRTGYRIQSISIFDARYNLGEVAMVYGRVYATWHNRETDDYLLFFGGDFPTQQFTVVLPGHIARKYSWRPERYFLGEHMTITGLITTFDGIPEILVKNRQQIGIY